MRIDVHDGSRRSRFDDQTRAYAEYRVFSSLATVSDVVEHVRITLAPADPGGADPLSGVRVHCRVTVTMAAGRRAEAAARGRHPYDAIDRAARRIRRLLQRQRREQPAAVVRPLVPLKGSEVI